MSTSADTLNPAQTTNQKVYSVTSGGGNGSSLAFDYDNSNEWGHMQGFDFNQTYESWWNITKFDYYVTSRGSSDSASLAGFIFDGVNKGEGEQITNGKGVEFANDSISTYSWNTATFSSPYPKVKELTTYYAGILPTNPADRSSNGCWIRWDYSSSDVKGGVQGYHTNQGASSWLTSLFSVSGADFLMEIYADEASNDDLAASLEDEYVLTTKKWGENSSRDDYTGVTEDTFLDEGQPSYDMGTDTYIRVGDDGSRINRTLIKYDLIVLNSLISSSSQIVSATLKMKTYDDPDPGNIDVDAFRVKKDWFEGTKSYAAADEADDAATWQYQVFTETQ